MPLYEYACPACAATFSRLRPLAAFDVSTSCPQCGADAGRTMTAFSVARHAEASSSAPPPPAAEPSFCRRYPHIPLLCHMEPVAAARWIARAEGREQQHLEREARRQEAAARDGLPPPPAPSTAHAHHFGHVHVGHAGVPSAPTQG